MEPIIEPARPEDLGALLEMARRFHAEDGHALGAEGEAAIAHLLEGEAMAHCWIVRRGDKPIGYLVLTLGYSVEYGGRDGFVDDLYLSEEARGQGLGRSLLDFAIDEARALGIGTLHLEVDPLNESANRLYRRRGFIETGRRLMHLRLRERPRLPLPLRSLGASLPAPLAQRERDAVRRSVDIGLVSGIR